MGVVVNILPIDVYFPEQSGRSGQFRPRGGCEHITNGHAGKRANYQATAASNELTGGIERGEIKEDR